jgi:hypothetical protein
VYLLFVDESGTHGGSPVFVLGGAAIHEDDAQRLQRRLDDLVIEHLGRLPPNLDEYELHAGEMRNAKKPGRPDQRASIWATVPRPDRLRLLAEAYREIAEFRSVDPDLPLALFGVAVDARFRAADAQVTRERFAYEVLLNKFDVMLMKARVERSKPNRGLVIHDRRVVVERDIQSWTAEWRTAAGNVGQLRNLADVPLFADSRATRLLQVADLVSYALFRQYSSDKPDSAFEQLWPVFHADKGVTHGCVHFTPSYGQGDCTCRPCEQRLLAEAALVTRPHRRNGARTT